MKDTVLIIHGIGGHAGIHWQQWLYNELFERGYKVLMPEMPEADHPDRKEWLNTIEELVQDVDLSKLIIVGHSLGVPTALDFIESLNEKIKALISVSGFGDDYGAELNSYFMKIKDIDYERVRENVGKSFVFYGDDDPYVPQENLSKLAKDLDVDPRVMKNGGHLNTDTGYAQFPLLLEIVFDI